MVQLFSLATALAAASFGATGAATVEDTCVLVDFYTATADFIGLNNVLNIVGTSPALLATYVSDPTIVEKSTLADIDFSVLGIDFAMTPTIEWLNFTGITTISPMQANVTSTNTLDLGTTFTGEVSVAGTFSVEIEQLDKKWYDICWTSFWHQSSCPPKTITVDVALALDQPSLVSNIEANMYQCAEGISTSVCTNLTMTSILVAALGGDLTSVVQSVETHFKDASLNSLTLGWNSITNIDFYFHESSTLISNLINSLLDFSADELNKKGEIYNTFVKVLDKLLMSLLNNLIDSELEPLFGATCL